MRDGRSSSIAAAVAATALVVVVPASACTYHAGAGPTAFLPGGPAALIGSSAGAPVRETSAAATTPTAYQGCGPGALPETGLQGEVPLADQISGRSKLGYRCNLRLVGETDIRARGANFQLAWKGDCAYVGIIGNQLFQIGSRPAASPRDGVAVIDASNPRRPRLVKIFQSAVGRTQHEALEVNERRNMLVLETGGLFARWLEIYDVSDCRNPVFKSRYDAHRPLFHGLRISSDGRTVYTSDQSGGFNEDLDVFDVSDMSHPRLLKTWNPYEETPREYHGVHDLDLSPDGTRAYLGGTPPGTLLGTLVAPPTAGGGPSLVTLDTTDIQRRRRNPDLKVVSSLKLPNFGHTVQRARIGGEPYLFVSGEAPQGGLKNCPWAWGHVIDMRDERNPREIAQIRLEVNERSNCARTGLDNAVYSIHYAGVDDERRTTRLFDSYYTGGLRVFDVRNPAQPRELGYWHPAPEPRTEFKPVAGPALADYHTPAWDSTTSVVRYRPETGHIWVVSLAGGFQILEGTGPLACEDRLIPRARLLRARITRRGIKLRGRARDRGCHGRLRRVRVSVGLRRHGSCRYLGRRGRLGPSSSCSEPRFLRARGRRRFRLKLRARLPHGGYRIAAQAVDAAGNRGRLRIKRLRWRG